MTGAAGVYGGALYDLAVSEGISSAVLQQLGAMNESFAMEPEFLRLLASPNLSKQERCAVLDDSFRGKVHPYVLNFLKILTEKDRIRQFSACVAAYREQYNADNGILPVIAVTACALLQEQKDKLTQKLSCLTGKTVELTERIDPAVLGGIRLDYNGMRLDDTVRHRLDAIREQLTNTVL